MLKDYTLKDIKGYGPYESGDTVSGRWGSFWDVGEEDEIVKCSRWWVRNLRQFIRRFARANPLLSFDVAWRLFGHGKWMTELDNLYDEMVKKWPDHAWRDTDVVSGHIYDDVREALAEVYPE